MDDDGSLPSVKTFCRFCALGQSVSIRLITIDDIPAIYHLGEKLFTARNAPNAHRTWDEYEVVGFYQTDCEFCFVAEDEKANGRWLRPGHGDRKTPFMDLRLSDLARGSARLPENR